MPDAPALLPCPLCNQAAHFFRIDDHDSREFGGEGICCETTGCAQIGLMFPVMEDVKPLLRERWNRRPPSPACEGVSAEPIAGQRITAALQDPGCERLREWAAIGPVQRAAVELFADLIAAAPTAPPVTVAQAREFGEACARAAIARKSEDLIGLAHELWAMAQGSRPVEEAAEAIAQRIASALGDCPSGTGLSAPLRSAPIPVAAGEVRIVEVLPTHIWIEDDIMGGKHIMLQHGSSKPFEFVSLNYSYAYTSNGHMHAMAEGIARDLGAVDPIERRFRQPPSEWFDGLSAPQGDSNG